MTSDPGQANRFDRRRAKTRAALVEAAQAFLAEGQTGAPIQKVTERADVGIGTFYNHFASKEELFEVAVREAVETYAVVLEGNGRNREVRVPSPTDVQAADAAAPLMNPGESIVSIKEVEDDAARPLDAGPPKTQAEEFAPVTPGAASLDR